MESFEDKLKEIQDKLSAQVEKHRQDVERAKAELIGQQASRPPTSHFSPPISTPRTLSLPKTGYLNELDKVAEDYFHFEKWLGGKLNDYPIIYCETLEEYYQPFIELLPVSGTSQQAILEELRSKAKADAEQSGGGGEFGVHWPGRGCYLNGWLFAYNKASSPMTALRDHQILPSIMATAAHEKFGHGFITECTAWGQEKKSIQLWRYDIAQRFNLQLTDTPREALLSQKWNIIFSSSKFCEEGCATWMERFLLHRLQETGSPGGPDFAAADRGYTLDGVMDSFRNMTAGAGDAKVKEVIQKVVDDLEILLGTSPTTPETILEIMTELSLFDDMFSADMSKTFGQPFRYVLGFLLLEKIAKHWGEFCVPYAVLLATNVTYGIDTLPVADLELLVQQDSRLNIDARLALLTFLPGEKSGDPKALARSAQQQLNMAVPQALA